MNKLVGCVVFGALGLLALGGCATEMDDEPEATTTAEFTSTTRAARAGECQLGAGGYCGGNGVDGAANVLYWCNGDGTVSSVRQCYGPCVRMPAGQHDVCRDAPAQSSTPVQSAPSQSSSSGSSSTPKPAPVTFTLKKSNWQSCTADSQCASSWCGCNGGSVRQCLPSTQYTKTCRISIKFNNWIGCSSDGQCASNRCGCNGGNKRVCLPNAQYTKTCRGV